MKNVNLSIPFTILETRQNLMTAPFATSKVALYDINQIKSIEDEDFIS